MPSPFPGMDPWLEAPDLFPDLHDSLIFLLREALNAAMPPGYAALGAHLVWVDDQLRREPDVSVFGPEYVPNGNRALATLPGLFTLEEEAAPEPWEVPYLEIRADRGQRLVTAVEILSPANKAVGSAGRKAYLDKREEYRLGDVNLVELDLLRGGTHTTAVRPAKLERVGGRFDYHVSVRVAKPRAVLYAAPIKLTDLLPAIGIPLDSGVPPVVVDLQPLLDRAYDTGRYPALVRYDRPPDPPLTPEQSAWAAGVLRAKGVLPPTEG